MSPFIQDVEGTIDVARRSRHRALRVMRAIEDALRTTARPDEPAGATRISIVLPSLTAYELAPARALNLNRRAVER